MYMINTIQLHNKKLRIDTNTKVMDEELKGINQQNNHNIRIGLIIDAKSNEKITRVDEVCEGVKMAQVINSIFCV
jgi:hypothetical protein